MRDNLHEDLFADHAWGEMNRMLDQQMPERKRRGAFWLWFLPALGLCVLLGRDSLLNPTIPVAAEKPALKQAPIAQLEQTVKNADQKDTSTPKEPTSASAKIAVENQPKVAIAALNKPVQSAGKPSQAFNNASVDKTLKTQAQVLNKETESPTTPLENSVPNDPRNMGTVLNDRAIVTVYSGNELQVPPAANLIPSIAQREMELTMPYGAPETMEIQPRRAKQKLKWWAEAGTQLASGVSGLSGYRAGIATGIPMGRLRLQTGLGFEQTEAGFQSVERDVLTGKENFSAVKLSNADKPGLGSATDNTQSVSSIQLHFIHWYLGVQYPLTHRLGLAVGGNVHYLESIKLGDQFIKESFLDNSSRAQEFALANGNNGQLAPQFPSESLTSASFRSLGYSAQVGLSYRLTNRWSVRADYRQSLQHFTKANNLLLKPQWLDFGLRYRIK